jgi:tetratricopeptide (TPR) repeat protein
VQPLGSGGMGTVWRAEQEVPVRREVALKVIKPGLGSEAIIARFEAERQALALMDHPHIARVLDAGATAAGRPYFVMELVPGVPITQFCDERGFGLRQRLALFIPVCRAVQHAHQKGIVHRDLKPSNVLVGLYDGQPVPKVIDFGIAKATGAQLTEQTLRTTFGTVVGTLEYMAPEQAELNAVDIDTRADLYSLGVLLYELLTGSTPRRGRLKDAGLLEVLRLIREQEPERPSVRLAAAATVPDVATARGSAPARLARQVKGDLDWIALKCLEQDRSRRYETANGLARDLERYLADEPVEAGPPKAGYRLRKLVRRHKGPVLPAALVLLTLVAGIVGTTWGLIRADQARRAEAGQRQLAEERNQAAKAKEQEAQAVLDFFRAHVLAVARPPGPDGGLGVGVSVRDAVQAAEPKIADAFADRPLAEAAIRSTLGSTYWQLGEHQAAIAQYERALALRRDHLGADDPETLTTMNNLATAYRNAGQPDRALPLFQQVLVKYQETLGPDHPDTLISLNNLAVAYQDVGQLDQAIPLLERMLAKRRETLGLDHFDTLVTMNNLAGAYEAAGQLEKALPLYEQTLAKQQATLPPNSVYTLMSMGSLARAYQAARQPDKAVALLEQALPKFKEVLGADDPRTLTTMNNLALAYWHAGRRVLALALFEQTLAQRRQKPGPEHPDTLNSMNNRAYASEQEGDFTNAERLFRESLTIRQRKYADHWATFATQSQLGGCLFGQTKYAEAEPLLVQGYEGLKQREARIPGGAKKSLTDALERLVWLYDAMGRTDRAAVWRQQLSESARPNPPNPCVGNPTIGRPPWRHGARAPLPAAKKSGSSVAHFRPKRRTAYRTSAGMIW